MNILAGLIVAGITVILGGDWWIKRRRLLQLPGVSEEAFLEIYAASFDASGRERDVLKMRHQIARELGLPVSKLSPVQSFTQLRDRYCRVVSGHLALDDLLEDLWALRRRANLAAPQGAPTTVGEYIDLALPAL